MECVDWAIDMMKALKPGRASALRTCTRAQQLINVYSVCILHQHRARRQVHVCMPYALEVSGPLLPLLGVLMNIVEWTLAKRQGCKSTGFQRMPRCCVIGGSPLKSCAIQDSAQISMRNLP